MANFYFHSSGSQDKARVTVRSRSDVDDIQLLNVRFDSLDVEAARSGPGIIPSEDGESRLLSRSPWIFRTALSQHYPLPRISMPAMFGKNKSRDMSSPASQSSLKPAIPSLHTSRARLPTNHYQASSSEQGDRDVVLVCNPGDGHVHTRVWASDANDSMVLEGTKLEGVRIERHISSSSEISPPKRVYI